MLRLVSATPCQYSSSVEKFATISGLMLVLIAACRSLYPSRKSLFKATKGSVIVYDPPEAAVWTEPVEPELTGAGAAFLDWGKWQPKVSTTTINVRLRT